MGGHHIVVVPLESAANDLTAEKWVETRLRTAVLASVASSRYAMLGDLGACATCRRPIRPYGTNS